MENVHENVTPGTVLAGRYAIRHHLGSSEMGSVYLASDQFLGEQLVALRIVSDVLVKDEESVKHFLEQVKLIQRVKHGNLVRIIDGGVQGNLVYFTMEFVNGDSLDQIIYGGKDPEPLEIDRIAHIAEQMAAGLAALHAADLLHLDLNLKNIFVLDDDTVKITGFGPDQTPDFQVQDRSSSLLAHHYLAPEIWFGQKLTPSVDLYSLGVILYEMATGKLPFVEENQDRLKEMHAKSVVKPPRSIRPDLPPWLNLIILSLLKKKADGRPKSAAALLQYFEANRGNRSQFTRMPEIAGELEIHRSATLVMNSQIQPVVEEPPPVTVVKSTKKAKRKKHWIIGAVAAAIAAAAIILPASSVCACTTVEELIANALGFPAKMKLEINQIAGKMDQFIPHGTVRAIATKKLSALVGAHSDWCSSATNTEYRCHIPLEEGRLSSRSVDITIEFKGTDNDRVSGVRVSGTSSFLWTTTNQ